MAEYTLLAMMPAQPRIQMALDMDLLGTGFYIGQKNFITVDVGERFDLRMDVPSELFVFLKDGMAKDTYNFKDFTIHQNAYLQASVGYKRDLGDLVPGLSVGAKVKFLAGIDRIDIHGDVKNFVHVDNATKPSRG